MFLIGSLDTEGHSKDLKYGIFCQAQQRVSYLTPSLQRRSNLVPQGSGRCQWLHLWRGFVFCLEVCSLHGILIISNMLCNRTNPKKALWRSSIHMEMNEFGGFITAQFCDRKIIWTQSSGFFSSSKKIFLFDTVPVHWCRTELMAVPQSWKGRN